MYIQTCQNVAALFATLLHRNKLIQGRYCKHRRVWKVPNNVGTVKFAKQIFGCSIDGTRTRTAVTSMATPLAQCSASSTFGQLGNLKINLSLAESFLLVGLVYGCNFKWCCHKCHSGASLSDYVTSLINWLKHCMKIHCFEHSSSVSPCKNQALGETWYIKNTIFIV